VAVYHEADAVESGQLMGPSSILGLAFFKGVGASRSEASKALKYQSTGRGQENSRGKLRTEVSRSAH
jgi:hypothetical protein